jgi:hypothetical protein
MAADFLFFIPAISILLIFEYFDLDHKYKHIPPVIESYALKLIILRSLISKFEK